MRTSVERERRLLLHHHEIAGRHQADPTGTDGALDGGDRRPGRVHEALERPDERIGVTWCAALRGAFLQVGAGAERRTGVREDDRSGVRLLGGVERAMQAGQQLPRQRIAVVLRIERDRGDAPRQFEVHDVRLGAHRRRP